MQRHDFIELYGSLCEYHNRKFNATAADVWYRRMGGRASSDVRAAFEAGMGGYRQMPTLEEVCQHLPRPQHRDDIGEAALTLSPAEVDFNLELWPHFRQFSSDVQNPTRQKRLDAFDLWHMTFKGVCYKHRRVDLYDADTWAMNRSIHERGI